MRLQSGVLKEENQISDSESDLSKCQSGRQATAPAARVRVVLTIVSVSVSVKSVTCHQYTDYSATRRHRQTYNIPLFSVFLPRR